MGSEFDIIELNQEFLDRVEFNLDIDYIEKIEQYAEKEHIDWLLDLENFNGE